MGYHRLRWPSLVNFILYQTGWFAVVVGAAWGHWIIGSLAGLLLIAVHLGLTRSPMGELRRMLVAAAIGLVVDTVQLNLGTFSYASGQLVDGVAPVWILLMWMQFSTTLDHSMSWLRGRPWISAAAGLVGGPLAFWAGERLGAIVFAPPRVRGYLVLALVWAAALPLLSLAAERWRGDG